MENQVLLGDCAETLKRYPDETFDCIVTDPPYGYSFMGKQWDKALPSLEALKECCRVLKSGAFAFFMSAPRQDVLSRMILKLEEAGFDIGFTSIYWTYAQGFPKASAVDKLIDKRKDDKCDILEVSKWLNSKIKESGMKYSDLLNVFGFNEGSGQIGHWTALSLGAQPTVPTWDQWLTLKEVLKLSHDMDNEVWRLNGRKGQPNETFYEREVIGKGECGDPTKWYEGKDGNKLEYDITIPATEKAKQFEGSFAGFNPKPAVEIIIVCMKPLSEKTYVDQALKNGKGVTWLGDCRIPYENDSDIWKDHDATGLSKVKFFGNQDTVIKKSADNSGRFPANLLVSDDVLNDGVNHKSGAMDCIAKNKHDNTVCYGEFKPYPRHANKSDGSFSRYFDLDTWFKSKLSEQAQTTYPFMIVPKPAKSEKNKYCENKHPTVKPLKLMSYLITMGSGEGDLILDPFAGSGTTLEAARLLNRKFVGCELTEEYLNVLEARAGVKASQCPYRSIIEICEPVKSIEDLEKLMSQEEQNSYYNLLLGVPFEFFDMVRKAYWIDKGMVV